MKRVKLFGILFMTMLFLAGCGNKEASPPDNSTDKGQNNTSAAEEDNGADEPKDTDAGQKADTAAKQADVPEQAEDNEDGTTEKGTVKIYYIDDASGEMLTKEAETGDEQDIWSELQKTGIITEECELLDFEWNEAESRIELDFNSALGDRIRSMGTTGKMEIIGCVVNTYLDAYNAEGIHLTEEGEAFDAGDGSDYNGYTGKIEL